MERDRRGFGPEPRLPADRAFVVHFRTTPRGYRRFAGRVEHLSSGTHLDFESLRALLQFFVRFCDPSDERCPVRGPATAVLCPVSAPLSTATTHQVRAALPPAAAATNRKERDP